MTGKGLELREWQKSALDRAANSLRKGKIVALQSPTGTGKTLFSLLLLLKLSNNKVTFVVRTHSQFSAVYRESQRLSRSFSFLMGKSISCLYSDGEIEADDIACRGCDKSNWVRVNPDDSPSLYIGRLKEKGKAEGFCPYHSLLNSLEESDILALTYPYVFLPSLRESLWDVIGERGLIIDEAHNIDWITDFEERTLTSLTLDRALNQAKSREVKEVIKFYSSLVNRRSSNEKLERALDFPPPTQDQLRLLEEDVNDLREEMAKSRKFSRNYVSSLYKFLKAVVQVDNRVYWFRDRFVVKPLDPSNYLNFLNEIEVPVVLMSGTLPPVDYMRKVWDIKREIDFIDTEKFLGSNGWGTKKFYLGRDVTTQYSLRSEGMWRRYASYLMRVFFSASNSVLSVVPSYEIGGKIAKFVQLPELILEREGTTLDQIERIVNEKKSLILAVARGKLSEGVEFTQDGKSLISDVVIVGIPYPVPDDYQEDRLLSITERTNISPEEMRFIYASMLVRQAIGRAIRSREDSVNIWLLDKRFDTEKWKRTLKSYNPIRVKT